MPRGLIAALLMLLATPALADDSCRRITHEGRGNVVCEVAAGQDLRLFLTAPDGRPYGSFARINAALQGQGQRLAFAMNGGMYHPDRSPVGLTIEDGTPRAGIVSGASVGNFGLLPNGVFCIRTDGSFAVIETRAFTARTPACRHATQSGPMLVIGGGLHPRFLIDSDSRYIRNGVGVSADGQRAFLVISDAPVTFHEFGRLFRDGLGLRDALYLDGSISRLHAPALRRNDWGQSMGPILGLVVSAP